MQVLGRAPPNLEADCNFDVTEAARTAAPARLHASDAAPDCRAEGLTDATVCVSEGPSRAPGEEGHIPAAVGNLSAADALLHARLAPGRRRVFLTVTSCGVFALRPLGAT